MTSLASDGMPGVGEVLHGRYLLERRIGSGGMGIVYQARDQALGRTVAVKVFRGAATDDALNDRKASETRLLASVNHHSLVTLFDAHVESEATTYLVMEHVDGPTLRSRINEGPIARRDVAVMARDLGEALHAIHDAGIVHRDIKPSNVLLHRSRVPGEEFRAKLADFGIAYLVDSTRLTTPGTLVGTAAYLSPEQVRGQEPAPASDVYSLGLVLIEALLGERAYPQTGTHEAALARLSVDPVIPGELGYGWKSLLTAMTSREAEQRPTPIEIVVAARALEEERPEPGDTLTEAASTIESASPVDSPTRAYTVAIPSTSEAPATASATAVTELFTAPGVQAVGRAQPHPDAREAARRPGPARALVIILIAVLVIAVVAGIVLLTTSQNGSAPELPALQEPLSTHMQQLLDSVTR